MNKLSLGTVQFGMPYGIANLSGRVPEQEVESILDYARKQNIDSIDTAIGYGESEATLGRYSLAGFEVVSKIGGLPAGCANITEWVTDQIRGSLDRLGVNALHGILLHDPGQLFREGGPDIYAALIAAKERGMVEKVGISIYDPLELEDLIKRFSFDIVQAPFNVLDNRLIETGWLDRLHKMDVEFHVRSIFLQGLLLMNGATRPAKFQRWNGLWSAWGEWLKESGLSPVQACLRYSQSFPQISRVIVGVDSLSQLQEICEAAEGDLPDVPPEIHTGDLDLLNPSRWSHL